MSILDWLVVGITTSFIVLYGLWKSRKSNQNMQDYLRSDNVMPWYIISLSVISTQASAITFLSAPGQAYIDGMRFVLFYLGLPLAMIVVSLVLIPIYYKLNIITAYEFLESRFDAKVRVLTAFFFLIQRGLSAAISIAAPSIVLSIVLGWDMYVINLFLGGIVAIYTVLGGSQAVSHTQKLQMLIILFGMGLAGYLVVALMPAMVSFDNAMHIAGKTGKLNTMDFKFSWDNQYNIWTGLIGGFFLQLAYFGTDQSQVGRYLGGSSIAQSRLGLLFNGIFKIPMQFCIFFIGAMLFVFYQFSQPPMIFNKAEMKKLQRELPAEEFNTLENKYALTFQAKKEKTEEYVKALKENNETKIKETEIVFLEAQEKFKIYRSELANLVRKVNKNPLDTSQLNQSQIIQKNNEYLNKLDSNYIFLTFVTEKLGSGLVGLLIIVIIFASMSTTASELNALASTTVVDIYKRIIYTKGSEKHYLSTSKIFTIFWAIFTIVVAQFSVKFGSLIEVVNILGSWFYGTILGIFALALFFKNLNPTAVFIAGILTEILIILIHFEVLGFPIAYLWLNMIGCLTVILLSMILTMILGESD